MEILAFLVLLVLLIIVISLNSFVRDYFSQNRIEMMKMRTSLDEIKEKISFLGVNDKKQPEVKKTQESAPIVEPTVSIDARVAQEEKTYLDHILQKYDDKELAELEVKQVVKPSPEPIPEKEVKPISAQYQEKNQPLKPVEAKKTFFEQYPDLEKFVGENLINKLGIAILVLGIAFFVKYAIDQNWINEIGRVAIGILSAGILLGVAHKLQKEFAAFSSVLIGGGLATLYFTITLAFHTESYPLYHQQAPAFIILVCITMFAVFLSIAYNRMEIAILAIMGGFGSPLMLSNGEGNYIVLFSYLILLNIGMLFLSYYKKWRAVNIVAFAFTSLLFGVWLISQINNQNYSLFVGGFCFATAFYMIFFLMNILYNFKTSDSFKVGDISLILSNTVIYFSLSMIMLAHIDNGAYKGLFSISLGVVNFVFAYYLHSSKKADRNLFYLLIGLVLTFVTLAIPLQLDGNYITLFWAVESVLLLWLSQKSGFKIMELGSVIVISLMLFSLAMDWSKGYGTDGYQADGYVKQLSFLVNKMFFTTLVAGGSLLFTLKLVKKDSNMIAWIFEPRDYRTLGLIATLIVFYVGGFLEIHYQAYHYFVENTSQQVASYTYNSLFFLAIMLVSIKVKERSLSVAVSALCTLFLVAFLPALSTIYSKNTYNFINGVEVFSNTLLIFRWTSILAVYAIGILLFKQINHLNDNKRDQLFKINLTLFIFLILYLLSADLDSIGLLITKNKEVFQSTQRAGYAILWGISSFTLMIIGMKRKEKFIRILSLVLFAITIFKLFFYDISNISEGGKIIAFILLGVLLLIMSFMYQKVKKLVTEDDYLTTTTDNKAINSND